MLSRRSTEPASQPATQSASQPANRAKKRLPKQNEKNFPKMKVLLETFPKNYQTIMKSLCFTMSCFFLVVFGNCSRGRLGRNSACGEAWVAILFVGKLRSHSCLWGGRSCNAACGEALEAILLVGRPSQPASQPARPKKGFKKRKGLYPK